MPNCNDQQRANLIYGAARRCSLATAEGLLERAIVQRDSSTIKTVTAMRDHALSVTPDPYEGYIKIDAETGRSVTDAFYSTKIGERLRPVECKPEDCATCFWRSWCEAKEHFDLFAEVDRVIQRGKDLMKSSETPKKDTKQTWNADSYESKGEQEQEDSGRSRRRRVQASQLDSPPRKWRENN